MTHDHTDHYSPDDIEKVVGENTVLIASVRMGRKIEEDYIPIKKVILVRPSMFYTASRLEFDTVAAYNTLKPFHSKGAGWVGSKQAAELINTIRPDIAIPTHYGSIVGSPGDGEVFAQNVKEPTQVEFKMPF